jgi:succinate dehydrogenase / fumarate reductase membrane anchor subunit
VGTLAVSLVNPLRRVLGAGPARSGVHHWWMQRLTALALVPLSIWFVVSILCLPGLDHVTVVAWMGQGWTAPLLVLFVLTAAWHSKLGLQVIVEDYVHGAGAKTLLLVLSAFVHVLAAAAALFAVLKVAFGAGA